MTDALLPGSRVETKEKLITTKVGDEGTTSLGVHGFVSKTDARVELLGNLDLVRSHINELKDVPSWFDELLKDIMVSIVRPYDLKHQERLGVMEQDIAVMRENVTFADNGWFTPTTGTGKCWDRVRVLVRQTERVAWRVFSENEAKSRFKMIAQLLNRLSDYCYLMAMVQEKS
jgi:cob(I)alamin adenosyltransferase